MNDDQLSSASNVGQENVMERVRDTFYDIYDYAGSFISDATANVGDATRDLTKDIGDGKVKDLAGDADNIASSLGETATGVATSVGVAVGDKLDAAVTFARGLFGG